MLNIEKVPVTSSNIEAIGFDFETARVNSPQYATLRVWFKNGAYDYEKVPHSVFEEFKNSKSIGSYFASNIKGKYTFKKI